jgi:hypothetical protein
VNASPNNSPFITLPPSNIPDCVLPSTLGASKVFDLLLCLFFYPSRLLYRTLYPFRTRLFSSLRFTPITPFIPFQLPSLHLPTLLCFPCKPPVLVRYLSSFVPLPSRSFSHHSSLVSRVLVHLCAVLVYHHCISCRFSARYP